ncbi:hypothetical protein ABZ468_28265 [Streptomyces sp. NPDC005708]|uniref:hypothetical protein n=1 Tax=Streptomyces sp. NPDC005708 TaxID=3154564 RepID=UPI0033C35FA6
MAANPDSPRIETRYARQFAADLETNRAAQEETITLIASQQERLEQLKRDEEWLLRMQKSLPTPHQAADTPDAAEGEAPVPQPRQEETGDAPSEQAQPAAKKAAAKKTTAKKTTAKKATAKNNEPPLRELVEGILRHHTDEPRMVSEVREELIAAHPDRSPSPQLVRNALEAGVAKGRVERFTQQGSVMYTLAKPATSAADEAGAGAEEAEKSAVPA